MLTFNFTEFQKLTLNYLAFLKVEIANISETQKELLEIYNNIQQNGTAIPFNMNCDYENDYFISNWPIADENNLIDMENKIKNDPNFHKLVVSIF